MRISHHFPHKKVSLPKVVTHKYFVFGCAFITALIALLALTGWAGDIAVLKSVVPGYPEMRPVTALSFVLVGAGIFLAAAFPTNSKIRLIVTMLGIGIAFSSALILGSYFSGVITVKNSFVMPDIHGVDDNRMSPHTPINFLFVGISLALLHLRGNPGRLGVAAGLMSLASAYSAILGHLYGANQLYGISNVKGMAIQTAFVFVVVSIALTILSPYCKMVSILTSDSLGGMAARRLLPTVILLPTFIGWLRIMGQERGLFDSGFGSTMSIFTLVSLMLVTVVYYTYAVHASDSRRSTIEDELVEKEQRYRELFDYSQGMICIHDLTGKILTANPATVRSLGYTEAEIVGTELVNFLPESQRGGFATFLRQIEHEGLSNGLLPLVAKNGKELVWRYHSILITEPGKEPYVIGHAQDVTELIAAQKLLKNLSLTDEMTGLYNRRGFLTMAEQQIKLERHSNTARGLTLMFADMDGLKKINDAHGHEAGSDAIVELSKILNSALRSADLVARFGGDEFVMLTIGSQDGDAEMILDRITDRIAQYNETSGKPYTLACSIGVVPLVLDTDKTFESMIAEADEAMYAEKRRRKAEHTFVIPLDAMPPKTEMQGPAPAQPH